MRHRIWLLFVLVMPCILFVWSNGARAEILNATRSAAGEFADCSHPDSTYRYGEYKGVLAKVFQEIEVDSLYAVEEAGNDTIGYIVVFRQKYRGLPVESTQIWLRVLPDGNTTWAGISYHKAIDLGTPSYLAHASNQDSLRADVKLLCPEIDSVYYVQPVVYPFDHGSYYTYHYALWVMPYSLADTRLVDWETGELYLETEPREDEAHGHVDIFYSPVDEESPPVYGSAGLCGWVDFTWYRDDVWWRPDRWPVIDADGDWTSFVDGDADRVCIQAFAQNEYVWVYVLYNNGHYLPYSFRTNEDYQDYVPYRSYDSYFGPDGPTAELADPTILWHITSVASEYNIRYGLSHRVTAISDDDATIGGSCDYSGPYGFRAEIRFGHQCIRGFCDAALWRDIVVHEWAHSWHYARIGGGVEGNEQRQAASEGFADAIACFRSGDHFFARNRNHRDLRNTFDFGDFAPLGDDHSRGQIISGAFWDLRHSLTLSGRFPDYRHAVQYARDMISLSPCLRPSDFKEWAWATLVQDDDNGNLSDGTPNGKAICEAFHGDGPGMELDRGIPCEVPDDGPNCWDYYQHLVGIDACPEVIGSGTLNPQELEALDPGNGRKMVVSSYGTHSVYVENGHVVYSWRRLGTEEWTSYRVSETTFSEAAPTLAAADLLKTGTSLTPLTQVFIAWKASPNQIVVLRHAIYHDSGDDEFYEGWKWCAPLQLPSPAIQELTAPVVVVGEYVGVGYPYGYPTVIAGTKMCTNPAYNGVWCWSSPTPHGIQYRASDAWTVQQIPGSESALVDAVSAHIDGRNITMCAYIGNVSNDHVIGFSRKIWSWAPTTVLFSGVGNVSNNHISIVHSIPIQGTFVSWEEVNTTTGKQEIYIKTGSGASDGSLDWSLPVETISYGICGDVRSPSLWAFRTAPNGQPEVPAGYPKVGIAFERQRDVGQFPDVFGRIGFRGLRVDEADVDNPEGWTWMNPLFVGVGLKPSLFDASFENGFTLCFLRTSHLPTYDLALENLLPTYPPALPPQPELLQVTDIDTLFAPATLTRSVHIGSGASYVITRLPGTPDCEDQIDLLPGVHLVVENGATLELIGHEQWPLMFRAYDSTQTWSGIKVDGGTADLNWCVVQDAYIGLRALGDSGSVTARNCEFKDCWIGVTSISGGNLQLDTCEIHDCSYYGGVVVGRASLALRGGSVHNNARAGLWTSGRTRLDVRNVEVYDNGPEEWTEETSFTGGIRNTFSSTFLRCVQSYDNGGPGLSSLGGFNDLAPNGKNAFYDNTRTVESNRTQLFFCSTLPNLCSGRNLIAGELGSFVQVCNSADDTVNALGNYWSSDPEGRVPSKWIVTPVDEEDLTYRCELEDAELCTSLSPLEALIEQAQWNEYLTQWGGAIQAYGLIIENWPESPWAEEAVSRIIYCAAMAGYDPDWDREYFEARIDSSGTPLDFAMRAGLAWVDVETGDYGGAQEQYRALLDSASNYYLYQRIAMDALMVELCELEGLMNEFAGASPYGSRAPLPGNRFGGNLDAELTEEQRGNPHLRILGLMEAVLNGSLPQATPRAAIPTKYQLYQNYPNPFNPNTEIRFDLPENVHVEIRVFNSLGQQVTTLVDEVRPAGAHRISWDSRNAAGIPLASGIYIYQIKAGNFTDAKKMVLIR